MAAPTRENLINTGIDSSSITVDIGNPTEDNFGIIAIANTDETTAANLITIDNGWTKLIEIGNDPSPGSNSCEMLLAVFTKTIDATDAGPPGDDPVISCPDEFSEVGFIELSGQATSSTINVSSFDQTDGGGESTLTASGVTTTVDDCIVYAFFSVHEMDLRTLAVSGAGWTEIAEYNRGNAARATLLIAEKTVATAGSSGDCTITPSSGSIEGCWGQVAIAPTAGGGGGIAIPTVVHHIKQMAGN